MQSFIYSYFAQHPCECPTSALEVLSTTFKPTPWPMAKLWPSGPDAQWWQQGIGSSNSLWDHLNSAAACFCLAVECIQHMRSKPWSCRPSKTSFTETLRIKPQPWCLNSPASKGGPLHWLSWNDGHSDIPLQSHTLRIWFVYCTQAPLPQANNSSLCPARKCVTKLLLKPELLRQVCSYDVSNPTSFTQTLRVKPQSRCPHSPAGKRGPLCWLSSATLYVQMTETKTPIVKTKISKGSSLLLHNQHSHPAASFHALFGDFMRSNLPPLHQMEASNGSWLVPSDHHEWEEAAKHPTLFW